MSYIYIDRMSEWLLFNAERAIILAISWREQDTFDEMTMHVCFILDQHVWLDFKVLAHWNNSPWVDMSLHSDT